MARRKRSELRRNQLQEWSEEISLVQCNAGIQEGVWYVAERLRLAILGIITSANELKFRRERRIADGELSDSFPRLPLSDDDLKLIDENCVTISRFATHAIDKHLVALLGTTPGRWIFDLRRAAEDLRSVAVRFIPEFDGVPLPDDDRNLDSLVTELEKRADELLQIPACAPGLQTLVEWAEERAADDCLRSPGEQHSEVMGSAGEKGEVRNLNADANSDKVSRIDRICERLSPNQTVLLRFLWPRRHATSFNTLPKESFQSDNPSDEAIKKAFDRLQAKLIEIRENKLLLEVSMAKRTVKLTGQF